MGDSSEGRRDGFAPRRLRMARDLAGVTQRTLGQAADVTVASVSLYERGGATPSSQTLAAFAEHLDVDTDFFYTSTPSTDTPAFFRSLRATRAIDRRRARHRIEIVYELVKTLETEVRFPDPDVPEYPVHKDQEPGPEEAARRTRNAWGVPPGPIDNMVRSVERHGVVVAQPREEKAQIDAYSVNFPDRPITVMSLAKSKHDRCRFDVAHELGHLVMHDPAHAATRWVEQQANQFAAAYLMPEQDIRSELEKAGTLSVLLRLKRKWRVSLAALIRRQYDLDIIDPARYTRYMKTMSARGWRRRRTRRPRQTRTTRTPQQGNATSRHQRRHPGPTHRIHDRPNPNRPQLRCRHPTPRRDIASAGREQPPDTHTSGHRSQLASPALHRRRLLSGNCAHQLPATPTSTTDMHHCLVRHRPGRQNNDSCPPPQLGLLLPQKCQPPGALRPSDRPR